NHVIGVDDPIVEAFRSRFDTISKAVSESTDIRVDVPAFGSYVAIEKGRPEGWQDWHQDALTWYLQQDNHHYLNVYVPIVKPDRQKSNMYVVPFDRLEAHADASLLSRLRGGGGRRARGEAGGRTVLLDDQDGGYDVLSCNLMDLAVIPELAAGDLLLMRGDLFHRTQDVDTDRVAVSFRLARASTQISRRRLAHLCLSKLVTLTARGGILTAIYQRAFEALEGTAMATSSFNPRHAELVRNGDADVSGATLLASFAAEMERDDKLRRDNLERLRLDAQYLAGLMRHHPATPYLQEGLDQVSGGEIEEGLTRLRAAQLVIASLDPGIPPAAPRTAATPV
ncbi:MAG: hypothetical protein ACYCW6_12995, partial [Candidatus Xenobia bacterium]